METFSPALMRAVGLDIVFVQDNHSYSRLAGTVRGIHFQRPPHAQAKLVRCLRGSIMDFAIDLRRGSPDFGRYLARRLVAGDGQQMLVPIGFGHLFITLEPDVEVAYKVSDVYAPQFEGGVAWNDAAIGIIWPLQSCTPITSPKDAVLPKLADFDSPFLFDKSVEAGPGPDH